MKCAKYTAIYAKTKTRYSAVVVGHQTNGVSRRCR
jgi:hypothetical protein